jgi:hypothetical protein
LDDLFSRFIYPCHDAVNNSVSESVAIKGEKSDQKRQFGLNSIINRAMHAFLYEDQIIQCRTEVRQLVLLPDD